MEDGKVVRGLAGVPTEGPVLYVGYHMLMGMELYSLVEEFLREKNILVRGVAHPSLFSDSMERSAYEFNILDWLKVFGALPVTPSNLFKMMSSNSHALLYPGGAREALHYKVCSIPYFMFCHQLDIRDYLCLYYTKHLATRE